MEGLSSTGPTPSRFDLFSFSRRCGFLLIPHLPVQNHLAQPLPSPSGQLLGPALVHSGELGEEGAGDCVDAGAGGDSCPGLDAGSVAGAGQTWKKTFFCELEIFGNTDLAEKTRKLRQV